MYILTQFPNSNITVSQHGNYSDTICYTSKNFNNNSLISFHINVVFRFLYCLIIFLLLNYYNHNDPQILKSKANFSLTNICCLTQPNMCMCFANTRYTRHGNGKGQRDEENPF